jgi:hypothetical protein
MRSALSLVIAWKIDCGPYASPAWTVFLKKWRWASWKVAGLGAGEVEADDRQPQLVARLDHRARQRQRGDPEHLLVRPAVEHRDQGPVVGREAGREHAQRAGDDAVAERRLAALGDRRRGLVLAPGAAEAAVDRGEHPPHVEPRADMELRREAHLDVAHALGQAVLGELEGDPFERLLVGQHGAGVGEAVEVVGEVAVRLLEHQLEQPLGGLRRQLDPPLAGQLDQRRQAQRAVEVDVEVGLRDRRQEGAREAAGPRAGGRGRSLEGGGAGRRIGVAHGRFSGLGPPLRAGRGGVARC